MNDLNPLIIIGVCLLLVLFIILYIRSTISYRKIYIRFKDIVDIEREKEKVEKNFKKTVYDYNKREKDLIGLETELKNSYGEKREIYEKLLKEISILEEDLNYVSYGVYKPHFDFDTSDKYKDKIIYVKNQQKEVIRNKGAAICGTEWTVSGSKVEGRKMTNRNIKLILRAFNNECDSAILKAKWNNVQQMGERIKRAYEAINKLGDPNHIEIAERFLQLKLDELHLAHEYREKLYEEKEEQIVEYFLKSFGEISPIDYDILDSMPIK